MNARTSEAGDNLSFYGGLAIAVAMFAAFAWAVLQ